VLAATVADVVTTEEGDVNTLSLVSADSRGVSTAEEETTKEGDDVAPTVVAASWC
jgi:hypothetical protein